MSEFVQGAAGTQDLNPKGRETMLRSAKLGASVLLSFSPFPMLKLKPADHPVQGRPLGLREHFVYFDLNVATSAGFCLGSCKSGRIVMSCGRQGGIPRTKSTKSRPIPDGCKPKRKSSCAIGK